VDKLRETRKDIYVVYCEPAENIHDITVRADMVLIKNHIQSGPAMAAQALQMGAKTFVHYSFPRHMSMFDLASRRDLIRESCEDLGIVFVDAQAPDPIGATGLDGTRRFIQEDVPRLIGRYGEDTVFFGTNCGMQLALIKAITAHHGLFVQPCCASPLHGFPEAFGIGDESSFDDIPFVINETLRIAAELNMTGRMSNWPVPSSIMFTVAGTEYAIKWLKDEAPVDKPDLALFEKLCREYLEEIKVPGVPIELALNDEHEGITDNVLMLGMGYLTY
jgi:hypothetical protein